MKKNSPFITLRNILLLLTISLFFAACKKSKSEQEPPKETNYMNINSGSSWTYTQVDNSSGTPETSEFTITSTPRDTSINGRTYHIYDYSFGGSQYLSKLGSDYFRYDTLPGGLGSHIELLYLKDKTLPGTKWSQDFNIDVPDYPFGQVPLKVSYEITDIGNRVVGGKSYSDVIHVHTTISTVTIPVQNFVNNIDSYYAPGVGLIENTTVMQIDFMTVKKNIDIKTTLKEAVLK